MNFDLATIASYCASLSTIIALVVLIVKPIRQRFVTWISKTSHNGTEPVNIHFQSNIQGKNPFIAWNTESPIPDTAQEMTREKR